MHKAESFSNRLRSIMRNMNIPQRELANRVGVSLRTMSMYCTGTSVPPTDTLVKMSDVLGVPIGHLAAGDQIVQDDHDDDLRRIASLVRDLEDRERRVLISLSYCLSKGDEQVRGLISSFAEISQRLILNTSLQRYRITKTKHDETASRAKKQARKERTR